MMHNAVESMGLVIWTNPGRGETWKGNQIRLLLQDIVRPVRTPPFPWPSQPEGLQMPQQPEGPQPESPSGTETM